MFLTEAALPRMSKSENLQVKRLAVQRLETLFETQEVKSTQAANRFR